MSTAERKAAIDFAGFLDRFEARNLASIERNIVLQLSEMQTRIALILDLTKADSSLTPLEDLFGKIRNSIDSKKDGIIDRLLFVGECLTETLIKYGPDIAKNQPLHRQVLGFVQAYLDAAEASHNDRLIDAAVRIAQAYNDTGVLNEIG